MEPEVTNRSNCPLCQSGDPGTHPDKGGTHQGPPRGYKAGDHVSFPYLGRETTGIIRTFQWQDWSDEPVALIDLDKPGSARSPRGASLGIRIEQRVITGKV